MEGLEVIVGMEGVEGMLYSTCGHQAFHVPTICSRPAALGWLGISQPS